MDLFDSSLRLLHIDLLVTNDIYALRKTLQFVHTAAINGIDR